MGTSNIKLSNSITERQSHQNEDSGLLNSIESDPVVRYGEYLSDIDHRHLGNFVVDLVGKRLLPHFSEVLRVLNEWVSVTGRERESRV